MIRLIEAVTAATTSEEFIVNRGETAGISAYGLAGAETAQIQRKNGDGTFTNLEDASGQMTATATQTSIVASGVYRVVKSITAGSAGVNVD